MKRHALKVASALALGLAAVGSASNASAWLKFKNNTANTIWTSHAWASTSGFGCGYWDACDKTDSNVTGYRVRGWWAIAPGGIVTVQSENFGNAWHQYYAEDAVGHKWNGGGYTFFTPHASAYGHCGDFTGFGEAASDFTVHRWLSTSRCCGVTCSPDNYTLTFVP
ncbi:MAG: hypothetical protein SFV15_18825 [Polyangiaceae bacterium]|nr:hypothetical protein [Polyangiaceae bacterium]